MAHFPHKRNKNNKILDIGNDHETRRLPAQLALDGWMESMPQWRQLMDTAGVDATDPTVPPSDHSSARATDA